jgi:two-component system, chemotaxis family, sensor kinase CheA
VDPTHRQLVGELEDRIEQIFAATEELREVSGEGKTTRRLIDSIFRNVHSLKASASSAGFEDLVQIAHQFENLLHALRVGRAHVNDEVLRGFDETAQALFSSLRFISGSTKPSYEELFARLASLSESSVRGERLELEVILNAVPAEIWQALKEEEKHRLKQAVGEGASLFLVATRFDIANFDELFQSLKQILTQHGELISTAPKVHNELPNKIDFRILYAREAELEQVQAEISNLKDVTVSEFSRIATETSHFDKKENSRTRYSRSPTPPRVIRIELADLDRLIASTHQLLRLTNRRFEEVLAQLPDVKTFSPGVEEVGDSIMSLAAALINLRMVPLERVLQRAFRAGSSVAAAADKEIDFVVEGQDLKIDKSLADAISDPLIHLVRNAVDHGIENKDERRASGKSLHGNIRIEASTQQGQTRIEVTDDGKGIDPELICRVGKDLGLLTDAQPDIDRSLRLLFRPGFTTAKSVSGTSGRGVGLDVVERTIEGLGGNVKVSSKRGSGSTFQMRLPVTFNTLDVVVVKEGEHSYLIDAAQVLSTTPLKQSAANGEKVLRLDQLLGLTSTESENPIILHCEFEKAESEQHRRVAVQVSEVISTEQVLVRNLGSRGGRWRGVAGAAEMRDGRVALLLDLVALIN